MTRKHILLVTFGVLALAVLGVTVATAQGPGPGRWRGWWGPPGPAWGGWGFGMLDLTAEQREAIRRIVAEQRDAGRGAARETRRLEAELRKAILAQDAAAVSSLAEQLAEAYRKQLDARIATEQRVAQVLTPEQRNRLVSAIERRLQR